MKRTGLLLFLCLGLGAAAAAQFPAPYDAVIFCHQSATTPVAVCLFDSTSSSVTTVLGSPPQAARGGLIGPRGMIYMGEWTNNGIGVLDPQTGTWSTLLRVTDPTNSIMGAPYSPAVNYDNVGGFGILCPDGNGPPTTLQPAPPLRNMFTVDYAAVPPTFALNSYFNSAFVPMADLYPNLYNPGSFVGIGYFSSDQFVCDYPLVTNPPATIIPSLLAYIPHPANYDATWLEDGDIWVYSYDVSNSRSFIQKVDIRTGAVTNIPINGLPLGFWGAIWGAPWEKPGMKGWILSDVDDTIYSCDFARNPIVATSVTALPSGPSNYFVNTGREAEECQLSSWWISPQTGQRDFHLNFGTRAANGLAVLAVSQTGLATSPLVLGNLEIYLAIDATTLQGLSGLLPYSPFTTLDSNGEADILWSPNQRLNLTRYFQAVAFIQGIPADASNIINVNL